MDAILERIKYEEEAKTKKCGFTGCNNQATHTWSGHPTCDQCGTPNRKNLAVPVLHYT
jgi:hypothetical protein